MQMTQDRRIEDKGIYYLAVWLRRVTFAESLPPSFSISHTVSHKGNSKRGRMKLTGRLQTHCNYGRITFLCRIHATFQSVQLLMSRHYSPWGSLWSADGFSNIIEYNIMLISPSSACFPLCNVNHKSALNANGVQLSPWQCTWAA